MASTSQIHGNSHGMGSFVIAFAVAVAGCTTFAPSMDSRDLSACPIPIQGFTLIQTSAAGAEASLVALLEDAAKTVSSECPAFNIFRNVADKPASVPTLRLTLTHAIEGPSKTSSVDARAIGGGVVSIATLGVAPIPCAEGEYLLRAEFGLPNAAAPSDYERRETVQHWGPISACPSRPLNHAKVGGDVVPKMIRFVYGEIVDDLRASRTPDEIPKNLVYVSVSPALPFVEQTTREIRPFSRVTFDEAQASAADYTLHIQITSTGGHSRSPGSTVGRGLLAIMTIGVFPMCPDTQFTLTARLTDREKRELKHYEILDSVRTGSSDYCQSVSPYGRPDTVAAMLRNLYSEMSSETVIPGMRGAPATSRR
jgi:hypothetical protein